ncbi:cell division protein FtsQ/DivIB [Streptomyces sp. NPDC057654]|uniref:cell division protein FtsQ/DivIB n=1 Tax=Streptomyces sp. NPDC057654 TaxID=3346196 RepID=UPI00368A4522
MAGPTTAQRGDSKSGKSKLRLQTKLGLKPKSRPKPKQKPSKSGPPRRPGGRRLPSRRALIVSAVAVVLVGGAALWALYGSSWLRATQVKVAGTKVLTPGEVRDAARVPLGAPLVSVDTDAIAARLRAELPRIDTVDVERSWPHGIRLKVTERQPEALIKKGAKFVEVDSGGVRFATVDKPPKGVPFLAVEPAKGDGPTASSLRRFGPDRLREEAVRVAGELPAAVRKDTRIIRVRSYDSITLELTDDRKVMWGSSERGAEKARTLTALMKAARGADHFDVSAPSSPAVSGS